MLEALPVLGKFGFNFNIPEICLFIRSLNRGIPCFHLNVRMDLVVGGSESAGISGDALRSQISSSVVLTRGMVVSWRDWDRL